MAASDNVFIGDLPVAITKESLQEIFSAYGNVVQCRALAPKHAGAKASGLVRFSTVEEATWVVDNLNGNLAEGLKEPIQVRFANNPAGGKAGPPSTGAQAKAYAGNNNSRYEPYGKSGGWEKGHQDSNGGGKYGKSGSWENSQQGPKETNSDNVFIGNLPEQMTKEDCEEIFSKYGSVVQCRAMPPKVSGGKASALVRFSTAEEAQWVVDNLNGNLAEGLEDALLVRFAHNPVGSSGGGGGGKFTKLGVAPPPAPKPSWNAPSSGYSSGQHAKPALGNGGCSMAQIYSDVKGAGLLGEKGPVPQENTIYVANLPSDCTDLDLYRLFSPFGTIPVTGVKAMLNSDGSCKGFGFVDFADGECAKNCAAALHGFTLPGGVATLHVSTKSTPKKLHGGKGKDGHR